MDISLIDKTYYLNLFVTDAIGDPNTGLISTYTIYRSSDNTVVTTGPLIDVGGGAYSASYLFTVLGQYYIIYSTPAGFSDEVSTILIETETAKSADLLRSIGLSGENKKIINPVYDANQNLTQSVVKLYKNSTDFVNNVNEIATYEMSATYNVNNEMLSMGVKRI